MEVFGWNSSSFEILSIDHNFYHWYPFAELETRYILNEILPLDANIIDVGSNVGLISIALVIDKPGRKVLAIEPSHIHAQRLLQNLQRLNLNNILLIQNPLSYRSGHLKGQIWESNGIKRIKPNYPYLTLDQVFSDWNQSKVDLVKIDTDGYELKILLGAKKLLRSTEAIFSIEKITSTSIFSTMVQNIFMKMFEITQHKISQALDYAHSISTQNHSPVDSIFTIDPVKFEIDSQAPTNFKLSNIGFEYSSSESHANIFSVTTELESNERYFRLPFRVLEGSLNVIVEDPNTGAYYSREIYYHEESQIILAIPEQSTDSVRITLRTGIHRKGNVVWTN